MIVCEVCQADGVIRINNKWFCTGHVAEAVTEAVTCAQHIRASVGLPPVDLLDIIGLEEEAAEYQPQQEEGS